MNFSNLFSMNKPQPTAAPQQQQQQQQPNDPKGGNPNTQPQGNNQNAGNNEPPNPLDAYSKMFDTTQNSADSGPPAFNIDPKVMDQVVGSQDFMKGIDPQLVQKATSGDMSAMMEIMQSVGRNAYRASMEHGGLLTDRFVTAREGYGSTKLGGRIKEELTTQALSSTPQYSHPVVKQQLKEIATRLQKSHPDAAPQEIAEMAKKYLNDLSAALNPQSNQSANNTQQEKETNWDDFFGS